MNALRVMEEVGLAKKEELEEREEVEVEGGAKCETEELACFWP